jgi:hypothetical protein
VQLLAWLLAVCLCAPWIEDDARMIMSSMHDELALEEDAAVYHEAGSRSK